MQRNALTAGARGHSGAAVMDEFLCNLDVTVLRMYTNVDCYCALVLPSPPRCSALQPHSELAELDLACMCCAVVACLAMCCRVESLD